MIFSGNKEMLLALEQAKLASAKGEVPIGAILVDKDNNILAASYNKVEELKDPTAHAEILAIREAAAKFDDYRLSGCTLYVTLEPCAMCASAIAHARIAKLVYGASDEKGGAVEHGAKIFSHSQTMHKPEIISGIAENECKEILQKFFKELR